MKPRSRKQRWAQNFQRRLPAFKALANMPPLSHWPDRSLPFDFANSQIIQLIQETLPGTSVNEARIIFNAAQAKNKGFCLIQFDAETKLWSGTKDTSRLIR